MKSHAPILIMMVLVSTVARAQDIAAKIEQRMHSRSSGEKFSGMILVAQRETIVLNKAFGMADYEHAVPNMPQTEFRIGSLTKPFTAMTILVLEERGGLSVQNNIDEYIEHCPDAWRSVTIRDLLTHTSGIPDLFGNMDAVPVERTSAEIDRVLINAKNTTLYGMPGETYRYNNFGYCLLGYIIEKTSSMLYAEAVQKYVLHPLTMQQTLYDDPRPVINNRASGYLRKGGKLLNDKLTDPAGYAAGGLLSTASDLLKLIRSLHTNVLLSDATRKRMLAPFKNDYGFGWKITTVHNHPAYSHTGETHGFSSHMVSFPNDELAVIVLSNIENESARSVAEEIAGIIFGAGGSGTNMK